MKKLAAPILDEDLTESKVEKAVEELFYFLDRNNNLKLDFKEIFIGLTLLMGG